MAKSREQLQKMLVEQLSTVNVYFLPPESVRIKYPAIIYELSNLNTKMANNSIYKQEKIYKITVIDEDPDSELVEKALRLPLCSFSTRFTSDNLYHTVFKLYY